MLERSNKKLFFKGALNLCFRCLRALVDEEDLSIDSIPLISSDLHTYERNYLRTGNNCKRINCLFIEFLMVSSSIEVNNNDDYSKWELKIVPGQVWEFVLLLSHSSLPTKMFFFLF